MDFGDTGLVHTEMDLQDALQRASRPPVGAGEEPDWHEGKPHCVECGEPFPMARFKAVPGGTSLCAACAESAQK